MNETNGKKKKIIILASIILLLIILICIFVFKIVLIKDNDKQNEVNNNINSETNIMKPEIIDIDGNVEQIEYGTYDEQTRFINIKNINKKDGKYLITADIINKKEFINEIGGCYSYSYDFEKEIKFYLDGNVKIEWLTIGDGVISSCSLKDLKNEEIEEINNNYYSEFFGSDVINAIYITRYDNGEIYICGSEFLDFVKGERLKELEQEEEKELINMYKWEIEDRYNYIENVCVEMDHIAEDGRAVFHIYEDMETHTATVDWYYIDLKPGTGTNLLGETVDLN